MSGQPGRLDESDYLLEESRLAMGTSMTAMSGKDPLTNPPALGFAEDPGINLRMNLKLEGERSAKINEVFRSPESGWGDFQGFMDKVFKTYRDQNDAPAIKKPKNQEEAIAQMQQMKPVQVDPNEVANIRQMVVQKLIPALQAADPRFDFWSDPRTKNYADWLNREAGPGEAGFMQSGEQEVNVPNKVFGMDTGIPGLGRAAVAAWQGVEGIGSAQMSLIHGGWDMARQSISGMGGPDIGPSYPTNYITGPDGKTYSNGGKAPSIMDGIVMLAAAGKGEDIRYAAAEAGRTQEWEQANRAGFGGIVTSVSRLGGELLGMGPGFGAAGALGKATFGQLMNRGLQGLGTLRLTKGLTESKRALKIIETINHPKYGIGVAAGMAGYEAMNQGRVEGYGHAFAHGMMMAPVLMTLGALGRKTEWFAEKRLNMPSLASRAVAGAMEGAGFGGVETIFPELLPSAWGFIRDPNQSTWESYAKNMMAFTMVKMASGRTTGAAPDVMQIRRGIGRAQFAEKVAEGKATPEEVAKAPIADEAKLRELGQVSKASREGKTVQERNAATKRQRELERELDIAEFGQKGPAQEAVKDYQGPNKPERRMPTMEEIQKVREMPNTPEKRQKLIAMMSDAHSAFGKMAAKSFADIGKLELAKQERELENLKELQEAGFIQQSLVKKIDIGKLKAAHKQALENIRAKETVEGREPGVIKEGRAADPLEDPRFRELPEAMQEEILAAPDVETRAQIFAGKAVERRVAPREQNVPRETISEAKEKKGVEGIEPVEAADLAEKVGAPATLEARQGDRRTPSGERAGPQSLQQQPTQQVQPAEGVQQVSARDIYSEMGGRPGRKGFRIPFTSVRIGGTAPDTVRTAIAGGKIPGRGVLGVFNMFGNLMRTKEGRDLAVGAHEWSHSMHRHTAGGGGGSGFVKAAKAQVSKALAGPDGPAIDFEMRETLKDYPGSQNMPKWLQWAETWAEWHARNLLGEVGLDKKLPAISAHMRGWLAEPAQAHLRGQYDRLQQMLYRYNAQGSLGRLRQSRVSGAAAPTETEQAMKPSLFKRAIGALNKSMLDDMAELKQSQDKWLEAAGRRPEDVSITEDPARMFDALRMTSDKTVDHFVNRGIRLPGGNRVPGLRDVMEAVKGREQEFQDFVVAVRSMELYNKGKETQLPPQDYVESVKQLTTKNPDFADQLTNLKRWTDALVDYVAGAGNISKEDAEKIKNAYVVYVPFFRAIEGPAQHGQGRGVAERGTGLSRIKGSTYEIKDPFVALQQVARSMVAKAHQNQVMSALFKMSVGQEAGGLASIVKRTNVPTDHPLRQLLDAIEKQAQVPPGAETVMEDLFEALRAADAINPQTVTTFAQKVIPTGERNIIAFTPRLSEKEINSLVDQGAHRGTLQQANNKLQWLEVDTKVYESLMGIDKMPQLPEAMQPVMQWLQAPRDVIRFFATGVAPGFVAANLVRDALSAPLFDRAGAFRPFGGFVKLIRGAIEYHRNGEMRELYEELGVKTSSFWTEGRQRQLIGEEMSLWQKSKAMADTVQNWFSHPENYIRMAEFKDTYNAAKAAGKSEFAARMEALEAGREITVNFARAGIWARVLNQTIPYFNAGLQGQRKLWGQLLHGGVDTKGDEAKARVQRGAILNGIANLTVPATLLWLLNKDEDWYQDLPDWRKVGYFNMKLGDQIVSVPKPFEAGTVFASMPEIMLDHLFGKNPAGMRAAMGSVAGPYLEVGNLIPAFLKPIMEVSMNQNLFTGRPLTPEWIARSSPPEEQSTFYTTETAKIMSKALGGLLSPIEIEALTGGYTAGAATKAMRVLDEVAGLKDHPGLGMNPMQRFTSQQVHGQSSFVDQLYSLGTKLEQNEETLSSEDKTLKRQVDTAKRQISELRKSYRAGEITQAEAERQSYEIARPLVEQQGR